mmetsp:Transcript_20099/g.33190  ORF Transcript_20099/g.33190 Transcript_20099/m.33190 type:complete len:306 (-) Transcript_20099:45-962(-)
MSLFNRLHNAAHAVGEFVTPVLTASAFEERGVLTPEEFVQAGDQLIRTCPTWQWATGDPKKRKNYLPKGKQFLITRGVTCEHRVKSLEENYSEDMEVEGVGTGDSDDVWLATHSAVASDAKLANDSEALDMTSMQAAMDQVQEKPKAVELSENEDGFIDLDDFVEDDLADQGAEPKSNQDDGLVKMRTYDLSMTYDKYYQTPRVWLYGYNEQQIPLSGDEVLEDIMQDYANKTVTIEPHPHLAGGVSYASIHPCKHAQVMKKIVEQLSQGGKKAEPSQYLFIFLKFIQSVIPTINYDNTIEVQAM